MRLVLTEGAIVVFFGLVVGVFGFLAMAQAAESLIFEDLARDPVYLGAAVVALAAAATAGSTPPLAMLPASIRWMLYVMNRL